ncbi:DUF6445 family protein [Paraglaciecola psychrophila]|uniref:Phytanoyl-CoA dioxygenase n=1 Tax=Paraglaciecola psychrophila 170 TaxID=1129794 RepID=K7AF83_9ALTE|nr:DUF6445 family protein [Paraglaciecola psychrophila]AGH46190.1 hypothetical protein C427_4085 [Paraglaciecola psychrophila 170]GAC39283.1 hypothetical protein GPSY_3672 [Paraglaciecola psychrophila 170]
MYYSLVVIDDFLDAVDALRAKALSAVYPMPEEQTYFPGRNAQEAVFVDGLDPLISEIVGEKLVAATGNSHGKFRMALAGEQGKGGVHIDQCYWSGILYLSKDEDCVGGTDFYRNKETKSDTAPLNKEQLKNMGFNNHQEFWDDLKANGQDVEQWQLTSHIPMKYNRLVLFRPWLFHNAGPGFGDSVENGRIIYPLFYNNQ